MTHPRSAPLLFALAGACLLAAVWMPGNWWQWLLTATIITFAGAYSLGEPRATNEHPPHDHPGPDGRQHPHVAVVILDEDNRETGRAVLPHATVSVEYPQQPAPDSDTYQVRVTSPSSIRFSPPSAFDRA